jgi:tetraacyldisaccharide 4'-kinase
MAAIEQYWYRCSPLHLLLYPLSLLFRTLVWLRRTAYRIGLLRATRLNVPVVVVGNISVGGTGKTPLTLALAQQLIERGRYPLIVSRGHGAATAAPCEVTPESTAQTVGDEPLLMAQRKLCPVWIGKDRAAAAQAGLAAHPECDVILCDDGLQHYRLARDFEIAVVDGNRRYGNGWLIPAGPLREPISRLHSVDTIVCNGGKATAGETAMTLHGDVFRNLRNPENTRPAAAFSTLKCHAAAGIGDPARFFRHLTTLGLHCVTHPFPDHHIFEPAELDFAECDALLLTEKDAVKCNAFADEKYWALRVDARVDPALIDDLMRKISPHGR